MVKILVTGSNGRFGNILKKIESNKKFVFRNKKDLNILSIKSISRNLKKFKPDYILHLAGLSRPMSIHEKDLTRSINLNIVGTCNLVNEASKYNIKLIYFSTSYVYEGTKGNYSEKNPVRPFNNYGLSKLGGECAVSMYKNSLILRISMTEKPFLYNKAFTDLKSNFLFHEDFAKILPKLVKKNGIINVGGKSQSIYNFAKKYNPNVKKIKTPKNFKLPLNQSMNITKLKKII